MPMCMYVYMYISSVNRRAPTCFKAPTLKNASFTNEINCTIIHSHIHIHICMAFTLLLSTGKTRFAFVRLRFKHFALYHICAYVMLEIWVAWTLNLFAKWHLHFCSRLLLIYLFIYFCFAVSQLESFSVSLTIVKIVRLLKCFCLSLEYMYICNISHHNSMASGSKVFYYIIQIWRKIKTYK